jgi:hypothetical protein
MNEEKCSVTGVNGNAVVFEIAICLVCQRLVESISRRALAWADEMAGDWEVWDVWLDMVLFCGLRVLSPRPPHSARLLKLRATGGEGQGEGANLAGFFGPLTLALSPAGSVRLRATSCRGGEGTITLPGSMSFTRPTFSTAQRHRGSTANLGGRG